jgi:isopenicillin-N N-acyltransferase-like protein
MDLPDYYDGSQTLLHVKHDDGLEALVFTPAGLIATTGLNSQGVGICCNTLDQLASATRGLPVAFVTRQGLAHASAPEAVRFIGSVPHVAGQNYTVGSPDEMVDLECSANKVVRFTPQPRRVYHTNHPLVNDDFADGADAPGKASDRQIAGTPAAALSNSEQRFASLEQALSDQAQPVTAETAQAILSTCEVPISVRRSNGKGSMTLGSLVMELSLPPVLHLSPGPPSDTAYSTWTFA